VRLKAHLVREVEVLFRHALSGQAASFDFREWHLVARQPRHFFMSSTAVVDCAERVTMFFSRTRMASGLLKRLTCFGSPNAIQRSPTFVVWRRLLASTDIAGAYSRQKRRETLSSRALGSRNDRPLRALLNRLFLFSHRLVPQVEFRGQASLTSEGIVGRQAWE